MRVTLQHVLALLPPDAALLVPTEGDGGVEDVEAIDPDGSRSQCPAQSVHGVDVVAENAGSQTVDCVVGTLHNLLTTKETDILALDFTLTQLVLHSQRQLVAAIDKRIDSLRPRF